MAKETKKVTAKKVKKTTKKTKKRAKKKAKKQAKKKRGRPKDSKNKKKGKRGRPKGSKNKPKTKSKPGRPKGSQSFAALVKEEMAAVQESVIRDVAGRYLQSLPSFDISLEQFVTKLQKAGAWDYIRKLSLSELAATIKPVLGGTKPKRGRPKKTTTKPQKRSGRLTKAEKAATLEKIPAFLKANPWSKAKDIAAGINFPPKKLPGLLRELLAAKTIQKQGQKAGTTYAVAGVSKGTKKPSRVSKPKKKGKK